MQYNPTIVSASLSTEELERSVNEMVSMFDRGLERMLEHTGQKVQEIQNKLQEIGQTTISFDQMATAQTSGGSSGRGSSGGSASGNATAAADNTIGALKEEIRLQQQKVDEQIRGSAEAQKEVNIHRELQRQLKEETTSTEQRQKANARLALKNTLSLPTNKISDAEQKLRALLQLAYNYQGKGIFDASQWNRLHNEIDKTKKKIDQLTSKQPKSLKDVLGMDETSVDAIAKKMAALKRVQIDPNNVAQVNKLGNEYQRLSRLQATLLGKNIQLTHSNNYLAQSFGYIRNRIVYALTLGALTNFVKQIYTVRGEYELLERSLGILTDNMRRGSEIFNELNAMALKSPFTLTELAMGAKQLVAYNFAEDEVVDTTRRLADISSALGVPMERLVYNLGQIRAQTVLTARDARDFANAGLAIVPMLADMYTKQKKFGDEIVTTAQVYDMMSNKMVSYADVMKVINSITDEGGKFFDFQAKQAETMRVQMNNLRLAYNNMLNELGKEHQSALTAPLQVLKYLFENWRELAKVIKAATVALGLYYARAAVVSLINGTLITQATINAGRALAATFYGLKDALIGLRAVMVTNPFGALAVAISTALGYMALFGDKVEDIADYSTRFGEDGGKVVRDVEALYGSIESLNSESSTYKKVVGELNQILGDFNLQQIDENANINEILKSREKNIQLIKEEILERKHLNEIQQGRDTYDEKTKNIREQLRANLSNAITENFLGVGTINEEIAKNAPALTNIIADIIESNIDLVANKTGEEYEKGIEKIFAKIQKQLRNNKALGLSEDVLNSSWLENNFFRFYKSNIITNVINDLKEAKEANDRYNESVNENYEVEKKAAQEGANFNDRIEQTSAGLMKAANDTDKFYGKIDQLIKDYSGQNIIDFLVRVNAQVPSWMGNMKGTELARLAARFAAIVKQGSRAVGMTKEETAVRAAQYAAALKQKREREEQEKTTTITKNASAALRDYKQALDGVRIAKNLVAQGEKSAGFVTQKEVEAQKAFNKALKAGVSLEELQNAKNGKGGSSKGKGAKKDLVGDAIQKNIQYITALRKQYEEYKKEGLRADIALLESTKNYGRSLQNNNAQLAKLGIQGLDGAKLATMSLRDLRDYYQGILDKVQGSAKATEALEKVLLSIDSDIVKFDQKTIADSLNNELGKLKDEYELAVALDADPEMGNLFAEMFGINTETLPKTIKEYADKATEYLNKFLEGNKSDFRFGAGELFNLTQDDIDAFQSQVSAGTFNQAWFDVIKKAYDDINGKRQKELQDIFNKTKELEYKMADVNGKIAIEQKKLSDLQIKWQKETNEQKKHYLELQIQDQKNAIEQLEMESVKLMPFYEELFGDMYNLSTRRLKEIIANAKQVMKPQNFVTDPSGQGYVQRTIAGKDGKNKVVYDIFSKDADGKIKKITISLGEYRKINKQIASVQKDVAEKNPWAKITDSFSKDKDGKIKNVAAGIEAIGGEISKMGQLTGVIGEIFASFSNPDEYNETAEVLGDISATMDGLGQAAQGMAQIYSGDIIGGATNVIKGLWTSISAWFDNTDKIIQQEIKDSEKAVKRLENSYKDLEFAVEHAYGMAEYGAKRAVIANKQLQLVEMQRQLRLEQSRESKYRDNDKILELKGSIIDLRNEIKQSIDDITNDLLGITSVGDAAEQLVSSMIDAFRQGEDYMTHFDESFEDMIDNMIMKAIVSRVIGDRLDEVWEQVKQTAEVRGEAEKKRVDALTKQLSDAQDKQMTAQAKYDNTVQEGLGQSVLEQFQGINTQKDLADANAEVKRVQELLKQAEKDYAEAIALKPEDVQGIRDSATSMRDDVKAQLEAFMEAYGIKAGDRAEDKNLSNLQQGIAGVSEETANAVEAYLNGMSQQAYLRNDLLMQIRDTVQSFDLDVATATQAQMLLQLQQSYAVQMAIQGILESVLTPNGRSFYVELAS